MIKKFPAGNALYFWMVPAIFMQTALMGQVSPVKTTPKIERAILSGQALEKFVVFNEDPNAPALHRLQGGSYNQSTHLYDPFYVNKNYMVRFDVNHILSEGVVKPATGNTTVDENGHPVTHPGSRKPIHWNEYWGLRVIVRKNGVDYKTITLNSQGDYGDISLPMHVMATMSGEGDYRFYAVQNFPDTATIRGKLTDMFKFNFPGAIDIQELDQSVSQAILKYKDVAGKQVYSLMGTFSAKKDFLVASLGDSFSSGEGNPMKCGQYESGGGSSFFEDLGNFAYSQVKDGIINSLEGNPLPSLDQVMNLADFAITNPLSTYIAGECLACKYTFINHTNFASCHFSIQPEWLEPRADRSYLGGIALASFQLERKHAEVATTFLSFATSGAMADNLYLSSQHDWQDRSQLDELVRAAGTRTIDALVISAGGNDAGFSDVITKLATGDWREYEIWTNANSRAALRTQVEAAISGLKQKYAEMDRRIKASLSVGKIYVLEYPIPLFSKLNAQNQIIDGPSCGMLTIANFNIDTQDAVFIREMGNKLNAAVKEAAQTLGWVYVDGIASAFDGHGYCSAEPYYEGAETSCNCQGDTNGILHPNQKGQKVLKDLLQKAIEKNYNLDAFALPPTQ